MMVALGVNSPRKIGLSIGAYFKKSFILLIFARFFAIWCSLFSSNFLFQAGLLTSSGWPLLESYKSGITLRERYHLCLSMHLVWQPNSEKCFDLIFVASLCEVVIFVSDTN